MTVFQVSLNLDPGKKILKIRNQIYILMNIAIILRRRQVTVKIFAPPFFKHFSLHLNRKKTCGNGSHDKEIKHIHTSAGNFRKF